MLIFNSMFFKKILLKIWKNKLMIFSKNKLKLLIQVLIKKI